MVNRCVLKKCGLVLIVGILFVILFYNDKDKNFYQENKSENKEHTIQTIIYRGHMPEIYVDGEQKTDNEYAIEYTPCINDNGIYAYALYNESTSASQIIVQNKLIHEGTVCRTLYIDDDSLYFSDENLDDEESFLWKYSFESGEKTMLAVLEAKFISKIVPDSKGNFTAEIWDSKKNIRTVKKITSEGAIIDIISNDDSESWIAEKDDWSSII